MKRQTEFRDTRFDVGNITATINQIKKNNEIKALLDQFEALIETMQGIFSVNKAPADLLIYKDKDGDEIDQFEFWDNLHYFVDRNHDFIMQDSANIYQALKKRKVA